jgi:hypothetical protein
MYLVLKRQNNYPIKYNIIKVLLNNEFCDTIDRKQNIKKIPCKVGDTISFSLLNYKSNKINIEQNLKAIEVSSSINNGLYITAYAFFFISMVSFFTELIDNIYINLALFIPMLIVSAIRTFKSKSYLNASKIF